MGDVAQILKDTQVPSPMVANPSKTMKMTTISKDVMALLVGKQDPKSAALPPIVPTFTKDTVDDVKIKIGNKIISSGKPARPWTWAPFASSARTDGAMFRHWVRANVEYTDYPYAKFDIHLDPVTYTNEEYATYLTNENWTKSETDKLMDLARKFELRWAVIHDRWLEYYYTQEGGNQILARKIEDLQERYYSVAAILGQIRITQEAEAEVRALSSVVPDPTAPNAAEKADQLLLETAAARALATATPKAQPLMTNLGTGSTNKMFDVVQERERRANLDRMWRRSKEEEKEEMELRKELREIETQLRKLKKAGGHLLAAAGNRLPNSASSRNPSRAGTPVPGTAIVENPDLLNQSFASTAPVPMPQNPYLQSGRLAPPAAGGSVGLNKSMLTRMQQVLTELKIPARPLPTKRVCDVYDQVRKDILTLITLQKLVMQKEGTLHAKRVKLARLGGTSLDVLDEEALLGITPPPAPHGVTLVSAVKKPTKSSVSSKTKPSASQVKPKTAPKPKPTLDAAKKQDSKDTKDTKDAKDAKDGGSKSKSTTKRKRKPSEDPGKDSKEPATKTPKPGVPGAATAFTTTTPTVKAPTKTATPVATTEAKSLGSTDANTEQGSGKKRARK